MVMRISEFMKNEKTQNGRSWWCRRGVKHKTGVNEFSKNDNRSRNRRSVSFFLTAPISSKHSRWMNLLEFRRKIKTSIGRKKYSIQIFISLPPLCGPLSSTLPCYGLSTAHLCPPVNKCTFLYNYCFDMKWWVVVCTFSRDVLLKNCLITAFVQTHVV